jgi:death-on-curing family protein
MSEERAGENEPVYLTPEDVLELYGLIVGATAAEAADHLRNRDGLESTLARPATYAHYEDADLALQAAVLAHGIAESQLFIDGNKRTALVAMLTFWRSTTCASRPQTLNSQIGCSASVLAPRRKTSRMSCARRYTAASNPALLAAVWIIPLADLKCGAGRGFDARRSRSPRI